MRKLTLILTDEEWRAALSALVRMATDFSQEKATPRNSVEYSRIRQAAIGAYHTIALAYYHNKGQRR
jgi:hypothetical protein